MPSGFASIDRSRSSEWAALAACALLGAIAAWLLARLVWLLLPRSDVALDAPTSRVGAAGTSTTTSISQWHLFGNTPALPGSGAGTSTLSLVLRGTLADRDPRAGIAVLSDSGRGERAYRAGETLSAGVRLERVYPDHIVLLHDGSQETLKLTRDENLAPSDIVRVPSGASPNATTAASNPAAAAALANAQAARISPAVREQIERLRQNPDELVRRVQIVPVFDSGKLSGVRVSSATDSALINQLGLRPGDVVTAVNGSPVDSLARGQQIIESLRSASSLRVTVMRDGKPTDVTVSLK